MTRAVYLDLDGTLMGPEGGLFRGAGGDFSLAGACALRLLAEHRVPVVLVSGRTRAQLAETGRLLGADRVIPELGALDCGYPTLPGSSIKSTIEATGIVEALIAHERGNVERFSRPGVTREATILLRGRVSASAQAFIAIRSAGTLRLADNGAVGTDGERAWHLLPASAGKGPAVARDLARFGLDPAGSLAVGNSLEDLEMGRAGIRIAIVGNGVEGNPELAATAPWVTDRHFGEGVLEAVECFLQEP